MGPVRLLAIAADIVTDFGAKSVLKFYRLRGNLSTVRNPVRLALW